MAKKIKASLGRGLGEIFGEITKAYENEIPTEHEVSSIPIVEIRTNPFQPRKTFSDNTLKELAQSIKQHGLLQPIVVTKQMDGYILIAGERRLRASKLAKMSDIKATVVDIDPSKFHELALIENIQREDLNPIELAVSYELLLNEHDLTHEELSLKVQKSRAQITNTLRLLSLGDSAKNALIEKKISQGHAKVLLGLDQVFQDRLVNSIIGQKLSVREIEQMVKKSKESSEKSQKKSEQHFESFDFKYLNEIFNKMQIKTKSTSEAVTLHFLNQNSIDELVRILSFNKDLSKK